MFPADSPVLFPCAPAHSHRSAATLHCNCSPRPRQESHTKHLRHEVRCHPETIRQGWAKDLSINNPLQSSVKILRSANDAALRTTIVRNVLPYRNLEQMVDAGKADKSTALRLRLRLPAGKKVFLWVGVWSGWRRFAGSWNGLLWVACLR